LTNLELSQHKGLLGYDIGCPHYFLMGRVNLIEGLETLMEPI